MKPIPNTTTINYKTTSNAVLPARRTQDSIHHYKLIQRLGFPDGVRCWCGAELEFAVKEPWQSRDRKRKVWFEEHEDCEAKEVQNG